MSVHLVLSTARSRQEGEKIARGLIQKKLAACVNVVPGLFSLFLWEDKVYREREVLLLIKTDKPKLRRIIKEIKSLHSYSVPEILFFKVEGGEERYLSWVKNTVAKKEKKIDKKNI